MIAGRGGQPRPRQLAPIVSIGPRRCVTPPGRRAIAVTDPCEPPMDRFPAGARSLRPTDRPLTLRGDGDNPSASSRPGPFPGQQWQDQAEIPASPGSTGPLVEPHLGPFTGPRRWGRGMASVTPLVGLHLAGTLHCRPRRSMSAEWQRLRPRAGMAGVSGRTRLTIEMLVQRGRPIKASVQIRHTIPAADRASAAACFGRHVSLPFRIAKGRAAIVS